MPAITASPSLTDGACLSAPSFPKSSPAPRRVSSPANSHHRDGHTSSAHTASMSTCPPAVVSHRVGCSAPWHPIIAVAALLPPVAAPAGMPAPGARRRGLEQPASCHPVLSSRYWSTIVGRTVTSPPLHRRLSAALLCHRFAVEMPTPGARQRCLTQRLCFLLPC
jgi:hypothetical protein